MKSDGTYLQEVILHTQVISSETKCTKVNKIKAIIAQ